MELGTIVFLGFGLAHDQGGHEVAGSVETSKPFDPSASMKSRRTGNRIRQVPSFIERFRKLHGRTPTGAQIRTEFPALPKSTAYDVAARAKAGPNPGLGLLVVR